jgi:hypothetical protein
MGDLHLLECKSLEDGGGGGKGVCSELIEKMCHLPPSIIKRLKTYLSFACKKGLQKMQKAFKRCKKAFFPTPFD